MNEPIDLSLPIGKYFKRVDDCIQYTDNRNTPYMEAKFIQKAHHVILE